MERMNGESRDREKTMRGLKVDDTAIFDWLSTIPQLYPTP